MSGTDFYRSAIISIHALLAESDKSVINSIMERNNFYPRSPCGERPERCTLLQKSLNFYPRSPCGERPGITRNQSYHPDFYPRSPCGERHTYLDNKTTQHGISIHALLAESDCLDAKKGLWPTRFLSTLSLRRATHNGH